jgi:hypothetical protein
MAGAATMSRPPRRRPVAALRKRYLLPLPTRGEPGQLRLERLGDLPPGASLGEVSTKMQRSSSIRRAKSIAFAFNTSIA